MYSCTFGKGLVGRGCLYFLVSVSFGSFYYFSLQELTCMRSVYQVLWTRKVLCWSFLCAILYKFSFIHSSKPLTLWWPNNCDLLMVPHFFVTKFNRQCIIMTLNVMQKGSLKKISTLWRRVIDLDDRTHKEGSNPQNGTVMTYVPCEVLMVFQPNFVIW